MRPRSLALVALFALGALAACSSSSTGSSSSSTGSSSTTGGNGGTGGEAPPVGGDRPVEVIVPSSYVAGTPAPLLLLLHGYSVAGQVEEIYFQLGPLAEKYGYLFAYPSGTIDSQGKYFWNATDGCCNFDGSKVDDSAYLSSLLQEISGRYAVDPRRVYLVGHSNGGFMSYRMACDHADQIAAIVSLAGAMWLDTAKCAPSAPVSVLQLHGMADKEVPYQGDPASFVPSAETSVQDWASFDGCDPAPDLSAPPIDFDEVLDGAETTVKRWATGCKGGAGVELWSIQGGGHIPNLGDTAREGIFAFLKAHAKP